MTPSLSWKEKLADKIPAELGREIMAHDGTIAAATPAGEVAQTLLDVRLGASTVIVVERLLGDPGHRRDLRVLHLLPVGGVLEDAHPDGVHGLDLVLDPGRLVRAVTDAILPPDVGRGPDAPPGSPGPHPVVVQQGEAELLPSLLGHPTVLAELTLVEQGGEPAEAYAREAPAVTDRCGRPFVHGQSRERLGSDAIQPDQRQRVGVGIDDVGPVEAE